MTPVILKQDGGHQQLISTNSECKMSKKLFSTPKWRHNNEVVWELDLQLHCQLKGPVKKGHK